MLQQSLGVADHLGVDPVATGPHPNLTMDIQMMVLLTGRERVISQWEELFRHAGLIMRSSTETGLGFTLVDGVSGK